MCEDSKSPWRNEKDIPGTDGRASEYLFEVFGSNQGGKACPPCLRSVGTWVFQEGGENGLRLPGLSCGSWSGIVTDTFDVVFDGVPQINSSLIRKIEATFWGPGNL